jgi:hypothetical protein
MRLTLLNSSVEDIFRCFQPSGSDVVMCLAFAALDRLERPKDEIGGRVDDAVADRGAADKSGDPAADRHAGECPAGYCDGGGFCSLRVGAMAVTTG